MKTLKARSRPPKITTGEGLPPLREASPVSFWFPLPSEALGFGDLSWRHLTGDHVASLDACGATIGTSQIEPHVRLNGIQPNTFGGCVQDAEAILCKPVSLLRR